MLRFLDDFAFFDRPRSSSSSESESESLLRSALPRRLRFFSLEASLDFRFLAFRSSSLSAPSSSLSSFASHNAAPNAGTYVIAKINQSITTRRSIDFALPHLFDVAIDD